MTDFWRVARLVTGCALLTCATFGVQRLDAQGSGAPAVGARVRVVLDDSLRPAPFTPRRLALVGTLTRLTPDSLAVRVANDTVHVARAAVRGLAVSRGASRGCSAGEQALLAGLVFAGAAYGSGGNAGARGRNAAGAGATGLVLGALAGALWPYEHWTRVRR